MADDGRRLAIGEVSARAGMSASRIRYYEARELIVEPERVSGRRRYAPDVCPIFTAVDFNPG